MKPNLTSLCHKLWFQLMDQFRKKRNFFGGGVAIYIKNTINYEVIKNIPETTLEILCIKVLPKLAEPFVIVSWYRPPLSQVACFEELENVLRFLELSNNEISSIYMSISSPMLLIFEQPDHPIVMWSDPIV